MNQLDAANAVITTVATAIAVTGTVTLDHGPGQGRRALTLLPDQHVCVVRASQIAPDVPEALNRLLDPYRPLTLVSGPSATSVGDRRSPPPCAQPPPGTARRTGPAPRRHAGRPPPPSTRAYTPQRVACTGKSVGADRQVPCAAALFSAAASDVTAQLCS
ncbi:LUD domain-containing protein [Streptomyces olindensis]|uniref:LUD domain-containing protein n=1 Tax=Streptomyces olindensis TaxID=358823 RepID=UPI00364D5FA4